MYKLNRTVQKKKTASHSYTLRIHKHNMALASASTLIHMYTIFFLFEFLYERRHDVVLSLATLCLHLFPYTRTYIEIHTTLYRCSSHRIPYILCVRCIQHNIQHIYRILLNKNSIQYRKKKQKLFYCYHKKIFVSYMTRWPKSNTTHLSLYQIEKHSLLRKITEFILFLDAIKSPH